MGNLKIVNDRDRDWPIKTVGITGLKKNFGRDGGIEEPYWGPSFDVGLYLHELSLTLVLLLCQGRLFHCHNNRLVGLYEVGCLLEKKLMQNYMQITAEFRRHRKYERNFAQSRPG